MQTRTCLVAFIVLALPGGALAQLGADDATLLLAHFDVGVDADFAVGTWTGSGPSASEALVEGRVGKGLALGPVGRLTFVANDGNFNAESGTVELWVRPRWSGDDGVARTILGTRADGANYINLNKLDTNRLGIAMAGGSEGDFVWERSDADVADWKAGEWHFIVGTWGGGEMHFFIDGVEVGSAATDAQPMTITPEALTIGGSDIVIDEVRISDRPRTPAEIKAASEATTGELPFVYLSDLTPSQVTQHLGTPGFNRRVRDDGTTLPLLVGGWRWAKGIAVTAPAEVQYELPPGYVRLRGRIGVDDLASGETGVQLTVYGDDRRLYGTGPPWPGRPPAELDVDIAGVRTLRLVAKPTDDVASPGHAFADWLSVVLLRPGADPPRGMARQEDETYIDLMRRKASVDVAQFEMPPDPADYVVRSKSYLDDIDMTAPPIAGELPRLHTFATPGELEPLSFVIYATDDLFDVAIWPGSLTGPEGTIPAENLEVRLVRRCLMRRLYTLPVEQSLPVSRFLDPPRPFDLPSGSLKEVWVTTEVPADAAPGTYTGQIVVKPAEGPSTEIPLSLEVLPFKLGPAGDRMYGLYYHRLGRQLDDVERVRVELRDIRAHGGSILKPSLPIAYTRGDAGIRIEYGFVRRGLELMREAGFRGPVPIETGFFSLALMLGHTDIGGNGQTGESLDGDEEFLRLAREAMEGLKRVDGEFPEFELLPTHMDEVFNRGRLPLYIRLTEAVRQVPGLRIYQTLHTTPGSGYEGNMAAIDPFVDVRCYNGHALDSWIQSGHTFDELADELRRSGDEAWIYYNARGTHVTAEWMRIINGLYMWWGPLRGHCVWTYQSYKGDPFDDTDGPRLRGHDFGYALPSPEDGITPVPTRLWEAYREGIDDMRYIATLEREIARVKPIDPAAVREAEEWLATLRAMVPTAEQMKDIELESPVLVAISEAMTGDDYQKLRYTTAQHIVQLRRK